MLVAAAVARGACAGGVNTGRRATTVRELIQGVLFMPRASMVITMYNAMSSGILMFPVTF